MTDFPDWWDKDKDIDFTKKAKKTDVTGLKKESTFQSEIKWACDLLRREKNIPIMYHVNEDLVMNSRNYDCDISYGDRRTLYLELKISKQIGRFNFNALFSGGREKEIVKLLEIQYLGFDAYILINHYHKTKRINTCYALYPEDALSFFKQGSCSLEELREKAIEIGRVKDDRMNRLVWDIKLLMPNL